MCYIFYMSSRAPGPNFLQCLMDLPAMQSNIINVFQKNFDQYGDVFCLPLGNEPLYVFRSPKAAKEILQDKASSFSRAYDILKPVAGEGLLTSEGETWRRARKLLAPLFHQKSIQSFEAIILDEAKHACETLKKQCGQTVDVDSLVMKATLNVISRSIISTDVSNDAGRIGSFVTEIVDLISKKSKSLFDLPPFLSPAHYRMKKAVAGLDGIIHEAIHARRKKPLEGRDMLDLLLGLQEEVTGEFLSSPEIRDHLSTMLLAGHESTATALSWFIYLMAKHPEIQARVAQEVLEHGTDSPLLSKVMDEVLRLYPPFWYLERKAKTSVEVDGVDIPEKSRVAISPYFVHRNPKVWTDANAFNPDRVIEKSAWIPFGGGARYCLGQPLATLEILTFMAEFLKQFKFIQVTEKDPDFHPTISLRARGGVRVQVALR